MSDLDALREAQQQYGTPSEQLEGIATFLFALDGEEEAAKTLRAIAGSVRALEAKVEAAKEWCTGDLSLTWAPTETRGWFVAQVERDAILALLT